MVICLYTRISLITTISVLSFGACSSKDYYDEELLLKPLPSGHIYAYFQFTTLWDTDFEANSCKYFGWSFVPVRHTDKALSLNADSFDPN